MHKNSLLKCADQIRGNQRLHRLVECLKFDQKGRSNSNLNYE